MLWAAVVPAAMLTGCRPTATEAPIVVSIEPLRYLIEGIVGNDYPIEVLVPPGASPETFEPTPRQMTALARAQQLFTVGWIDFERTLTAKLPGTPVVELHRGIEPITGEEEHAGHTHPHGIDPHIWTSPPELKRMARNAYEAIRARHPDSARYEARYRRLVERLDALDRTIRRRIDSAGATYFLIYHPALSYYARAYGLEQVAVEHEGKEPSARRLARLLDRARADGVRAVFYQRQYPRSVVETFATDLGAETVMIDPLRSDVEENLLEITDRLVAAGAAGNGAAMRSESDAATTARQNRKSDTE